MIKETLIEIFSRDLKKLIDEISLYDHEEALWKTGNGISNSAGNLCLHLIGNLNHFIGATLGGSGYIRKRDEEFSLKSIPRAAMIEDIEAVTKIIKSTLTGLQDEDFEKIFPIDVFNKPIKTEFMLVHLTTHLCYHLGQINYHRRLLS